MPGGAPPRVDRPPIAQVCSVVRQTGKIPPRYSTLKLTDPELAAVAYYYGGLHDRKAIAEAVAVALAESAGRPFAFNVNTNGSRDHGIWQINRAEVTCDLFEPDNNAKAMAALYGADPSRPWARWCAAWSTTCGVGNYWTGSRAASFLTRGQRAADRILASPNPGGIARTAMEKVTGDRPNVYGPFGKGKPVLEGWIAPVRKFLVIGAGGAMIVGALILLAIALRGRGIRTGIARPAARAVSTRRQERGRTERARERTATEQARAERVREQRELRSEREAERIRERRRAGARRAARSRSATEREAERAFLAMVRRGELEVPEGRTPSRAAMRAEATRPL